jgi:elongation factor 2
MSESANKLYRLYAQAEPLSTQLIDAIESGKINPRMDQKTRAKELQNNYG